MAQTRSINFGLLRFLKRQERPVLPSEIEDKLDIDHGDLIEELEIMADAGYEVELHPYLGVRLLDIPDRLLEHEISESLNTKVVGRKLHIFASCASTSDEIWALVEKGACKDGELALADAQTKGRGRMGRAWESAGGKGVYLSFFANLKIPEDKVQVVTCAASLAVANTIEQFAHLPATIKWPNDVYVGKRKVAGILVEARSDHPGKYVVGIGVNVNQTEGDFPEELRDIATSLRIERRTGPVNRVRLLRPLLFYLDNVFAQVRKKKFERVANAWKEYAGDVGKKVKLTHSGKEIAGTLLELNPVEGIRLRDERGKEQTFRPEHVLTIQEIS